MAYRSTRKTPSQRRAAGEFQLAVICATVLIPLAACLWLVTIPAGYVASPLNPLVMPLFIGSLAASFVGAFFVCVAFSAWGRK